jgi:hypothetical protein
MSILRKLSGHSLLQKRLTPTFAVEKEFREASLFVFADDAVIFAPNAVNGKSLTRNEEALQ